MGIIENIVNKFKFKTVDKLVGTDQLAVGEFENGRKALLRKGRIVDDDLAWVNASRLGSSSCSSDYFMAETIDGDYRVYDKFGEVVAPSLKHPDKEDFLDIKQ